MQEITHKIEINRRIIKDKLCHQSLLREHYTAKLENLHFSGNVDAPICEASEGDLIFYLQSK